MKRTNKTIELLLTAMIAVTLLAGCGGNKKNTIVVTSKNYNEQLIMGNVLAILIEENTDLNVERKLNLGGTNVAFEAIRNGSVDLYVEYTGTGYVSIMNRETTKDTRKAYEEMKKYYNDEFDIAVLTPLGYNNTYALATRRDIIERYNLKTISDLARVSNELVIGTTFEFAEREDGYIGLQKSYDLYFKDSKSVDGALRYQAIANGNTDVTDAFTTDGLLKMFDLVLLEDDLNFFPPYYAVPIVRNEIIETHPEVKIQLERLGGIIDEEMMIDMNYKVDKYGQDPARVAEEFLRENGLID